MKYLKRLSLYFFKKNKVACFLQLAIAGMSAFLCTFAVYK